MDDKYKSYVQRKVLYYLLLNNRDLGGGAGGFLTSWFSSPSPSSPKLPDETKVKLENEVKKTELENKLWGYANEKELNDANLDIFLSVVKLYCVSLSKLSDKLPNLHRSRLHSLMQFLNFSYSGLSDYEKCNVINNYVQKFQKKLDARRRRGSSDGRRNQTRTSSLLILYTMVLLSLVQGSATETVIEKCTLELPSSSTTSDYYNNPRIWVKMNPTPEEVVAVESTIASLNTPELCSTVYETVTRNIVQKSGEKSVVFVLGGAGTGKSTAVNESFKYFNLDRDNVAYLNTDDVMESLPEYDAATKLGQLNGFVMTDKDAAAKFHEVAENVGSVVEQQLIANNYNIMLDATGNNIEKLHKRVGNYKKNGYKVMVAHTLLDATTAQRRVDGRSLITGRFVPSQVVQKNKGTNLHSLMPDYLLDSIDGFIVVDTSDVTPHITVLK